MFLRNSFPQYELCTCKPQKPGPSEGSCEQRRAVSSAGVGVQGGSFGQSRAPAAGGKSCWRQDTVVPRAVVPLPRPCSPAGPSGGLQLAAGPIKQGAQDPRHAVLRHVTSWELRRLLLAGLVPLRCLGGCLPPPGLERCVERQPGALGLCAWLLGSRSCPPTSTNAHCHKDFRERFRGVL